jgi:hypothetical protein
VGVSDIFEFHGISDDAHKVSGVNCEWSSRSYFFDCVFESVWNSTTVAFGACEYDHFFDCGLLYKVGGRVAAELVEIQHSVRLEELDMAANELPSLKFAMPAGDATQTPQTAAARFRRAFGGEGMKGWGANVDESVGISVTLAGGYGNWLRQSFLEPRMRV